MIPHIPRSQFGCAKADRATIAVVEWKESGGFSVRARHQQDESAYQDCRYIIAM